MLTVEEIRNIQFTKALGGYKTIEVDDFVDDCVETVEALIAEKAEMNEKLSVLAQKVMEYRQEEDNIRTALLSAQKMGDAVVREAKLQAEQIVQEANGKAAQIEHIARIEIAEEQAALDRLKQEVSDFKANVLSLYRDHLELITALPDEKPAPVEEPAEEPVEEAPATIEEKEPVPVDLTEETLAEETDEPEEMAEANPVKEDEMEDVSSGEPMVDDTEVVSETPDLSLLNDEEAPTPVAPPARNPRYNNLRFGEGYSLADDDDDDEEEVKPRGRFKRKK